MSSNTNRAPSLGGFKEFTGEINGTYHVTATTGQSSEVELIGCQPTIAHRVATLTGYTVSDLPTDDATIYTVTHNGRSTNLTVVRAYEEADPERAAQDVADSARMILNRVTERGNS